MELKELLIYNSDYLNKTFFDSYNSLKVKVTDVVTLTDDESETTDFELISMIRFDSEYSFVMKPVDAEELVVYVRDTRRNKSDFEVMTTTFDAVNGIVTTVADDNTVMTMKY